jgi:diketogulonate reductase-like aldo/keto reductase
MTRKGPLISLNNGVQMPALGLGVHQNSPEQTRDAVATAIANGYRLIDTAAAYFNERQVGEGIVRSGIARSEMFVTTKLSISDYGYERALSAFDGSLRRLGLDDVDLYLLHWPVPSDFEATVASYRAAEKLLADGRARAIGVCNFRVSDLRNLADRTEVVPAVNQVELHPFFIRRELREANTRCSAATQSWSSLGGVNVYAPTDPNAVRNPLEHPVVVELASKYAKAPAQIVLRWHIDHGLSAIPKSVRPERIAENIDIFDVALATQEIAAIDRPDTGARGGPDPGIIDTKLFQLKTEEETR